MPEAPPLNKYDMKTWEWTVGREFYDHASERAAYLLEQGIELFNTPETAPAKLQAAIEAATWFEVCEAQDPDYATHNLKNLGTYSHSRGCQVGPSSWRARRVGWQVGWLAGWLACARS